MRHRNDLSFSGVPFHTDRIRLIRLRLVDQHHGDVVLDPVLQPAGLAGEFGVLFIVIQVSFALRAD